MHTWGRGITKNSALSFLKEVTSFTRNLRIPKTFLLHGAGAQISWMVETHKAFRITGACESREKTRGSAR